MDGNSKGFMKRCVGLISDYTSTCMWWILRFSSTNRWRTLHAFQTTLYIVQPLKYDNESIQVGLPRNVNTNPLKDWRHPIFPVIHRKMDMVPLIFLNVFSVGETLPQGKLVLGSYEAFCMYILTINTYTSDYQQIWNMLIICKICDYFNFSIFHSTGIHLSVLWLSVCTLTSQMSVYEYRHNTTLLLHIR